MSIIGVPFGLGQMAKYLDYETSVTLHPGMLTYFSTALLASSSVIYFKEENGKYFIDTDKGKEGFERDRLNDTLLNRHTNRKICAEEFAKFIIGEHQKKHPNPNKPDEEGAIPSEIKLTGNMSYRIHMRKAIEELNEKNNFNPPIAIVDDTPFNHHFPNWRDTASKNPTTAKIVKLVFG